MENKEAIKILREDIKRYSKTDIDPITDSQGLKAVLEHRKNKIEAYSKSIVAIEAYDNLCDGCLYDKESSMRAEIECNHCSRAYSDCFILKDN